MRKVTCTIGLLKLIIQADIYISMFGGSRKNLYPKAKLLDSIGESSDILHGISYMHYKLRTGVNCSDCGLITHVG